MEPYEEKFTRGGINNCSWADDNVSFMALALSDWIYPGGGKITRLDAKYIKLVLPGDVITAGGRVSEKHYMGSGKDYVVIDISAENKIRRKSL